MDVKAGKELALLGGPPAFEDTLHVGRPNIGDRERLLSRITEILDRRWLTNNGPLVQQFEQAFAELTGAKHCIAVCNGTIGLEIAIRAAGLEGEVIVPSFTFIATAHALQWQQIKPVFCDIDPRTHTIDPGCVEALITPRTTAIIGVHLWGTHCDIDSLQTVADRHRLMLMFDAAHAVGGTYQGRKIGNFGLAEVFSFHATKVMNAFEGGMVTTNHDDLAKKIRLMNNFGFTGMDRVDYIGTNGKMNEVSAAMGLTSLESLPKFVAANRRNHEAYRAGLQNIPGIRFLEYNAEDNNPHHYVVIEVDEAVFGLSRDELMAVLHAEHIRARRYFYPGCHRMEPYASMDINPVLPETDELCEKVLCLPTGMQVDTEDIEKICEVCRIAVQSAEEITKVSGDSS